MQHPPKLSQVLLLSHAGTRYASNLMAGLPGMLSNALLTIMQTCSTSVKCFAFRADEGASAVQVNGHVNDITEGDSWAAF